MGVLNENLTDKQELFCQYYIAEADFNATSAAKKAGYSEDTAKEIAAENLAKPYLQTRIKELMTDRMRRLQVTQDWVISELKKVAGANMKDYAKWNGDEVTLEDSETLDEDMTAAVSMVSQTTTKDGGSINFKLHDKVKALEKLGEHLNMFSKNINLGGQKDNPLHEEYTDEQKTAIAKALQSIPPGNTDAASES